MKKKIWDLYAPIYKQAMKADQHIYDFMYSRIPEMIRDKVVLEIATGPGLLARHVAPAAKKMIATDYSDGMIAQAKKSEPIPNLTFEVADAMNLPYADGSGYKARFSKCGICMLMRKLGLFEYVPVLCSLDYS